MWVGGRIHPPRRSSRLPPPPDPGFLHFWRFNEFFWTQKVARLTPGPPGVGPDAPSFPRYIFDPLLSSAVLFGREQIVWVGSVQRTDKSGTVHSTVRALICPLRHLAATCTKSLAGVSFLRSKLDPQGLWSVFQSSGVWTCNMMSDFGFCCDCPAPLFHRQGF